MVCNKKGEVQNKRGLSVLILSFISSNINDKTF